MTALLTHAEGLSHITPDGHPERAARLDHVLHALEPLDLDRVTAPLAEIEDLERCHPRGYIDAVRAKIPSRGSVPLDADTWVSPGSWSAALRAVGAATRAVDMVLAGDAPNAFCATRPPGHHAETERAMGFCLFGTVAIAAKHALDAHGLSRVAVVDFDVHHGNGTQDLLWTEERALFVSSHQSPLWPGSGSEQERGAHGQICNLPLAPGTDGAVMRRRYEDHVFPRLREFAPELLLISAGFDAHEDDPLANLGWETEDFRWLTRALCEVADEVCGGRVVSTLEGGYDLSALSESARAHVEELREAGR
ncbi:histone deacetylase family protein [Roseivivax jejudonensis]|nr:histone deacetylase family protein [Roseivivax jejudonensis]